MMILRQYGRSCQHGVDNKYSDESIEILPIINPLLTKGLGPMPHPILHSPHP